MAIIEMPFYTLILRVDVQQEISADGWRALFQCVNPASNFDGELMVFGSINDMDLHANIDALKSYGFRGPENGDDSDMVVWGSPFGALSDLPSWLSYVEVEFFDDRPTCKAWKLTNSQIYGLVDFFNGAKLPTKGYECDWEPKIGKI